MLANYIENRSELALLRQQQRELKARAKQVEQKAKAEKSKATIEALTKFQGESSYMQKRYTSKFSVYYRALARVSTGEQFERIKEQIEDGKALERLIDRMTERKAEILSMLGSDSSYPLDTLAKGGYVSLIVEKFKGETSC